MELLMATVVNSKITSPDDKKFIEEINSLIENEGDGVCQAVIKMLTDLNMPPDEARKIWFDIVDHREALYFFLGRDVALLTVIADYLSLSGHFFKNPKIVEFDVLEKALTDSRHDNLTGLLNRGCLWEILNGQLAQAKRHNTELAVLFIDVDDFKFFNDTFGHQAGDNALASIANVIREESRTDDVAIRYGGEELVVVMPNTSEKNALVLAERIREKVEGLSIKVDGITRSLTMSGGIASYPVDAHDGFALLSKADKALYRAKAMGKNNIALFAEKKQRSCSRSKLVRAIKIKEIGFDSSALIRGASKNISMGGMLFETGRQLDVGADIEVSIPIMNTEPLFLIGSVVRVGAAKMGSYDVGMVISFKKLEKAAKEEISTFLKRRKPKGKGDSPERAAMNFTNIVEM
jgi:diguanylate cyclase (GGDEF)-like protein